VKLCTESTCDCPQAVSKPASTKSVISSAQTLLLGMDNNVNQMRLERLLILPVLFCLACKPPTPAEQMDSMLSWLATARMTGESWLAHTTPDTYSRQTLELSGEKIGQVATELLKSPLSGVDTARLEALFTRSRVRVEAMARLIAAKDAPDFGRQLDSLGVDEKLAKELADSIEHKQ